MFPLPDFPSAHPLPHSLAINSRLPMLYSELRLILCWVLVSLIATVPNKICVYPSIHSFCFNYSPALGFSLTLVFFLFMLSITCVFVSVCVWHMLITKPWKLPFRNAKSPSDPKCSRWRSLSITYYFTSTIPAWLLPVVAEIWVFSNPQRCLKRSLMLTEMKSMK